MLWGSKKSDANKSETKKTDHGQPMTRTDAGVRRTGDPGNIRTTTGTGKRPTEATRKIVPRDELPRFLVTEGHISEKDVRYALQLQQETGVFFGEILAKEGVLGSQSLVSFLAKNCKIPHIGLLDYLIDKELLSLVPEDLCWKYHLLPVDKLGRNLTVAMVNPLNNAALQAVQKLCPDLRIKPILCSHEHFETVAQKLFGKNEEHDESAWAEVPAASADQSSSDISETTPDAVVEKTSTPSEPQAKPVETAKQEEEVPPAEMPDAEDEPQDEVIEQNSDKLLESVFGATTVKEATEEEQSIQEVPPSIDENSSLESIMHVYADAMVNSMHDTYELLARKISFFKGVNPEDVAKIFAQGNVVEFEPAQMLFDKGDNGDTMYVILNGRVKIRDGAKQIAILHSGDIFGEMSLVSDAPRSATAVTMTQSNLLVLSFEDILNKIAPKVAAQLLVNIIITLADRLRKANKDNEDEL